MKFHLAILFTLFASVLHAQKTAAVKRPNIIIIMADDMGYSDIGCYGSEIQTPNLDQLAKGGMRFTRFYNNARCCPSRASLMTGLYPHQAGIGQMDIDLKIPAYQGYLNQQSVTLAEVLKGAGYNTYMSGKWHIGGKRGQWPVDRGFDHAFSLINGVSNYFGTKAHGSWYESLFALDTQRIYPGGKDFYLTDAINQYAVQYIKQAREKHQPFFLYVAHAAPHWPLHALEQDIQRYEKLYQQGWDEIRKKRFQKMKKEGVIPATASLSAKPDDIPEWRDVPDSTKQDWAHRMAVYAAMVDRMDRGIGDIIETLRTEGQLENTYIFFLSDNGACAEDRVLLDRVFKINTSARPAGDSLSWQSYEAPWANVSNTPFRLYKSYLEEGGIATPFIAFHPKKIKAGTTSLYTGHVMDIMPTLIELSGIQYPKQYNNNPVLKPEGNSLLPALQQSKSLMNRLLFWEHEGAKAVRYGDWKLVKQHQKEWQLFHLKKDPTEQKDVSKNNPKLVRYLIAEHQKWEQRCGVLEWGPDMLQRWENRIGK